MSKMIDFLAEHPMLTIVGIVLLCIALIWWVGEAIPICPVCGQKEYHYEVDYYMTTFIIVDDHGTMIPQQTPVYKTVPHVCVMVKP